MIQLTGRLFFKMRITSANFQKLGILPLPRGKLKSLQKGNGTEWESSFSKLRLYDQIQHIYQLEVILSREVLTLFQICVQCFKLFKLLVFLSLSITRFRLLISFFVIVYAFERVLLYGLSRYFHVQLYINSVVL